MTKCLYNTLRWDLYVIQLTIRHLGKCRHKIVLTHDGQPYEHVGGHRDVEEDPPPRSRLLVQQGRWEVSDCRLYAGPGGHVGQVDALHRDSLCRGRGLLRI